MRRNRPTRVGWTQWGAGAVAVAAVSLSLGGCSAAELVSDEERRTPSAGTGRHKVSAPGYSTPAARSGDLGQEDLPLPQELGAGWQYRVDPGDAEEGYVGSGQPSIARDPASVVAAVTPLGCRGVELPMPTNAVEVTYRDNQVPGVGLVMSFADTDASRTFFERHAQVLRDCTTARRVDVRVMTDEADRFVSTRTEQLGHTPTWAEAMKVSGNRVTLIAVADPTRRGIAAVEAALG